MSFDIDSRISYHNMGSVTTAQVQHTTKFSGQAARHRAKDTMKHYRAVGWGSQD